jgi:hypothetical protein
MKERKKEKRKKYNKRTIFSNLIFDRQTDRQKSACLKLEV